MTLPDLRLALLLTLGLLLSACPPPPGGQGAAALDGVVLSGGRPAAGVTVRLAVDVTTEEIGCRAGGPVTVTDAQGHFSLPAPSSLVHHRLFSDTTYPWRLCVLRDDGGVWQDWHDYGAERLECELGAAGGRSRDSEALPRVNEPGKRGCRVHGLLPAGGKRD